MPGRSSQSKTLQYVGVVGAIVAVIGSVALGWEWGGNDDLLPFLVGAVFFAVAVGWTVRSRLQ